MKGREEQFPTVDLRTAAEERYLAYALSVITMRALPDVRDGLKPVQRRILYAMYQNLRLTAGTKPRKSAAVVGEVLGKYHPHGDVAAYEAMVRMAQEFALRYPLVHGEGNFGSLDGDNPAAMRYTEARLAAIAEELLRDIRNDTVDFRENYDATLREPVVLPAAIPQLLINGSTGIAVGMATNVPPHNLREVITALLALIEDPDLQVKDLCKHIKGPDFPTGGEILNTRAELRAIYETGQGAVRIRGQYNPKLEKIGRKQCIIVSSIPYTANKARIVEEIAEHIIARRLPQALDVRDESTDVVRIAIEIKPDTPPDQVMAYLFKHTGLQINFNVNLTALVPSATGVGQPARLNLKELCRHFLDFRLVVVTRRLEHELRELQARLHILEGFIKLFAGLDRAIKIIRESGSRPEAQKALMKAFDLDEIQTDAILETRLYQLARLEIEKIRQEQREKKERATEIERLLKSPKARWKIVSTELTQVVEKYGDARRTVLSAGAELIYDAEAYVVHEDATVVVTRDGWMKRVGEIKDTSSTRVREGDVAKWILRGNTRDQIVLASNQGVVYVMKAATVPATTGYGEPVQSLLNLKDGERIIHAALLPAQSEPAESAMPAPATKTPVQKELFAGKAEGQTAAVASGPRWLMASAGGMGFFCRPDLSETTRSGRRIARLKEGDEIVVAAVAEGDTITAGTKDGQILTFPADELPELAGAGRGVILMRLDDDDRLLGAICHSRNAPPLAIDEEGIEHRFNLPEPAHRAQKGRKVIKRFKLAELVLRER